MMIAEAVALELKLNKLSNNIISLFHVEVVLSFLWFFLVHGSAFPSSPQKNVSIVLYTNGLICLCG